MVARLRQKDDGQRPSTDQAARQVGLVGASTAHHQLLDRLDRISQADAEVLLTGPSGVGKELYARYIHVRSRRGRRQFIPVNCGALPDALLENEMFGHVSGAFTGARARSDGLVAAAEGGTLFLDEVDTLQLASQVKLLRFIQEGEYRRLGDPSLRQANVRIIAASNADLAAATAAGRFREDLFYRLRVIPVEVPSLRERPDDIPALLAEFVTRCAQAYGLPAIEFSESAHGRLMTYPWPGNVRELENCVRCLTCLQPERPIEADDLPLLDTAEGLNPGRGHADLNTLSFREAKRSVVEDFERHYVEAALRRTNGNISAAARLAGKHRRAFFELMRKYRIEAGAFRMARLANIGERESASTS